MSGVHGLTSAPGARSAVLRAPVRRALLLAVLVSGLLVTAWLASSAPVWAQEQEPLAASAARVGTAVGAERTPVPQAASVPRGGSDTDQSGAEQARPDRPGTERAEAALPDLGETVPAEAALADTGQHASMAARLNEPLAGAVTAVGGNAARVVLDTPAAVSRGAVSEGAHVARQVHGAVHGVTGPVEEYLTETDVIAVEAETEREPSEAVTEAGGDVRAEDGTADERPEPAATAGAAFASIAPESGVDGPDSADPVTETGSARLAADPVAPHSGTNGLTTASAQSAPSGVTVLAGYLPTTGAPAPAPGQFQAARHVLLSVPEESADEPTFAPD